VELADILSELWRRRLWLVVGLVVATFAAAASIYRFDMGIPPKFHSKDFEVGAASVDVLIDSPDSPLPDTGKEFDALQLRAGVYAQLIRTAPIRQEIGRKMGIPWQAITAEGPTPIKAGGQRGARTDAEPRATQLTAEAKVYRLFSRAEPNIPIVTVNTQAPDAKQAIRLADSSVTALEEYIETRQREQQVPRRRQVTIQRLSEPDGGMLTSHASLKSGLLAFLGVMFGWCVLVVLVSNVATSLRRAKAVSQLQQHEGAAAWQTETTELTPTETVGAAPSSREH
jgi:hypothetical protein